jgi:drug/metabolite transporter (DMT)-like permease
MTFHMAKRSTLDSPKRGFFSQNRGALLVLLSQVLSSLVNVAVKILVTGLQTPVHPVQILNTRMIVTLFMGVWYCWYNEVPDHPFGPKDVRCLMLVRAVGGACGALGFYYSLEYLPLGEATILNLLAPLGSCCFMAFLTPGSFSRTHVVAASVSVCSVVLIVRPSFLFPHRNAGNIESTNAASYRDENGIRLAGVMFALLGAGGGAVSPTSSLDLFSLRIFCDNRSANGCVHTIKSAYSCIRLIGHRAHPLISVNYFAFTVVMFTSVALLTLSSHFSLYYSLTDVILLFLIGTISFSTVSRTIPQSSVGEKLIERSRTGIHYDHGSSGREVLFCHTDDLLPGFFRDVDGLADLESGTECDLDYWWFAFNH